MKAIQASASIIQVPSYQEGLAIVELAGRTAYKSEEKITSDSAEKFVRMIRDRKHDSVLEHISASVKFICDRGVTHEIVRHRLAGYTQESTRYCNYGLGKFGNEITVIEPLFFKGDDVKMGLWKQAMEQCEAQYLALINAGASAQEARSVLPNSLKTEIVMTANIREWRHFFRLRTASTAHPQMREVTIPLLADFKVKLPVFFEDIEVK
jgi:thymidylate synthase (FAD)